MRGAGSAHRQSRYQLLPPLNDTNFSEQYKNFHMGQQKQGSVIGLPMIDPRSFESNISNKIQEMVKPNAKNK